MISGETQSVRSKKDEKPLAIDKQCGRPASTDRKPHPLNRAKRVC